MKKILVVLIIFVFIAGCAPSPEAVQTAIAKTQAVLPTSTFTSTIKPSSTFTLTPTNTSTPTVTSTPAPTNTATPLPPATLTKQAMEATQTQQALNRTETQKVNNKYATATSDSRTATAKAKAATATEMASYISIPRKELSTYPENYIGQKVYVNGRIFNILGNVIQIYFYGTYDPLYVNLKQSAAGIYEDDFITVYGVVKGFECFTNTMGNEVCQPALENAWFTKP